jgi:AcrR family transcriptional regulator
MDLLWGPGGAGSRGPRPALSVGRIADTAVEIADAEGLTAVTMQRLAGRFGFTAMSLYRYVPGRAELITLMIDTALGVAPPAEMTEGWKPALRAWAAELYTVFHRHPWLAAATTQARPLEPKELSWLERATAALEGTGLTGPERVDAALVVVGHVRGQVQAEDGIAADEGAGLAAGLLELLREHASDYPALVHAADEGAFGASDNDGFLFGLNCILDGIATTITARNRLTEAHGASGVARATSRALVLSCRRSTAASPRIRPMKTADSAIMQPLPGELDAVPASRGRQAPATIAAGVAFEGGLCGAANCVPRSLTRTSRARTGTMPPGPYARPRTCTTSRAACTITGTRVRRPCGPHRGQYPSPP